MQTYHQPYQQVYCGLGKLGGNPDNKLRGKFGIANCRFRLEISARPCPAGNTVRHPTPAADPSLPTTERGISGRGWQKKQTKRGRDEADFYNSDSRTLQQNAQCGGSNEDGKHQQDTTSKTISRAGDER